MLASSFGYPLVNTINLHLFQFDTEIKSRWNNELHDKKK